MLAKAKVQDYLKKNILKDKNYEKIFSNLFYTY